MGREANTAGHGGLADDDDDDNERTVPEWEEGLPSGGDLAPLSQTLITPELASAFGITPEPPRTILDVYRASNETVMSLRRQMPPSASLSDLAPEMLPSFGAAAPEDPVVIEGEESASEDGGGCYSGQVRRLDAAEEVDSPVGMENPSFDGSSRAQKRPRLVWTSQLHKRFVDVVDYVGLGNAVPKTIMHLMNVEGLTRENVASHLQKYRLYLKRNEGLSDEGPSSSDRLVTSTRVTPNLHETPFPLSMTYDTSPYGVSMPVLGMAQNVPGAHLAVVPVNGQHCAVACHVFEGRRQNPVLEERRMDFTGGNKIFPVVPYPHVSPDDR